MLKTCPAFMPVQTAAGDPTLPPLRTRVRLFDGEVFVITEDEGGGVWSERCLGPLSADLLAEVEREHHGQILDWIEAERDAIAYGRACREEQEIYW